MSESVDGRIRQLNAVLNTHAGGIEVSEVKADGTVLLRYTGQCTGCPCRPLTTAATVRPALLDLDEVTAVEIQGVRISEEAEARLAKAFGAQMRLAPLPRLPVPRR